MRKVALHRIERFRPIGPIGARRARQGVAGSPARRAAADDATDGLASSSCIAPGGCLLPPGSTPPRSSRRPTSAVVSVPPGTAQHHRTLRTTVACPEAEPCSHPQHTQHRKVVGSARGRAAGGSRRCGGLAAAPHGRRLARGGLLPV